MNEAVATTGKRAPYPAYKPSGVVWLGDVPEHWEVKRAKGLLVRNDGGVWGEDFDDEGIIVLRSTEQTVDGEWKIVDPAKRRLTPTEYASCRLQEGDLVVTKSSGSSLHIGKTSIVTKQVEAMNCCYSNFMQRLRVKRDAVPRFLWYVLNGQLGREQFDYYSSTTTGLANLNGSIIGNVGMGVPPLDEQKAIAAFLDRETARIDALIEKKRRQIELLQEKRSALISHAVTSGLDPAAPMKDSGIEWLGQIPKHWEVCRLRYLFRNLDYRRVPLSSEVRADMEKTYPYYGASGVIDAVEDYIFDEALILVAEDGANLLSRSTPLAFIATGKYWVNNHAHILKPSEGPLAYWEGVLRTFDYTPLISGAAQPKLTAEDLGTIPLPHPPVEERRQIADVLTSETGTLDAMSNTISDSIEMLREHRTTLISAAVTGKIDVRSMNRDQ
jgi:type I restriction enzyme, S subunit